MFNNFLTLTLSTTILVLNLAAAGTPAKSSKSNEDVAEITGNGPQVLWREPRDIASRSLFYGRGGKAHAPHGSFTFLKEDLGGSNPKFDVRDDAGVKWKVKLGSEARPETVASRLVWAVGYFANEDYFVPELRVQDVSGRLHRGANLVSPAGIVRNVRLKRSSEDEKKIGIWQWSSDPFTGTRELNGLRVLMAVINNWDLKDENNAVYQVSSPRSSRVYMVSDLGASFGTTGLSWTRDGSRGNLNAYAHSKWIRQLTPEYVDFNVPSRPALDHFPDIPELLMRLGLREIGWHIPRSDAKWMGGLLGRLSAQQIRDAFRAAGYDTEQVEGFSRALEGRIAWLQKL